MSYELDRGTDGAPARGGGEPTWRRTLRIVGTIVLMVLAGALMWRAGSSTVSGPDEAENNRVVVRRVPLPDAQAPRQTEVGVELLPGYDGRLTIEGSRIPEGELEGAVDPASVSQEELDRYGLRPNNRNRIFFRPGPDKVLEQLPKGRVSITVEYHKDRNPNQDAGRDTWTVQIQ